MATIIIVSHMFMFSCVQRPDNLPIEDMKHNLNGWISGWICHLVF